MQKSFQKIEKPATNQIINYQGTYQGVLPCIKSDCKEIELSVQLLQDQQYIYATKRIGIDDEPLLTTGIFDYDTINQIITLEQIANVPNSFYIEEGKIYQLDKNEQKIKGPDANRYILLKQ